MPSWRLLPTNGEYWLMSVSLLASQILLEITVASIEPMYWRMKSCGSEITTLSPPGTSCVPDTRRRVGPLVLIPGLPEGLLLYRWLPNVRIYRDYHWPLCLGCRLTRPDKRSAKPMKVHTWGARQYPEVEILRLCPRAWFSLPASWVEAQRPEHKNITT